MREGGVEELLLLTGRSVTGSDQLQTEPDWLGDVGVREGRAPECDGAVFVNVALSELSPALPPGAVRQPDLDVLPADPLAHQDDLLAARHEAGVVGQVDDLGVRFDPGREDCPRADRSQLVGTATPTARRLDKNLKRKKAGIIEQILSFQPDKHLETKPHSIQVNLLCIVHMIKSLLVRIHPDLLSLFQRLLDVLFPRLM